MWWSQPQARPNAAPWTQHSLTEQGSTNSLDVGDLDFDGHLDVVTAEHRGKCRLIVWENDGTGASLLTPSIAPASSTLAHGCTILMLTAIWTSQELLGTGQESCVCGEMMGGAALLPRPQRPSHKWKPGGAGYSDLRGRFGPS